MSSNTAQQMKEMKEQEALFDRKQTRPTMVSSKKKGVVVEAPIQLVAPTTKKVEVDRKGDEEKLAALRRRIQDGHQFKREAMKSVNVVEAHRMRNGRGYTRPTPLPSHRPVGARPNMAQKGGVVPIHRRSTAEQKKATPLMKKCLKACRR